jgi:hypothetical protein
VSVTEMELALRWNKIEDVYSANTTEQLIPLVLGLYGAIRAVYLVAKSYVSLLQLFVLSSLPAML